LRDLRRAALQQDGILDRLDGITIAVATEALARESPPAPTILRFLLRRYAMTGQQRLEAVLGPSLARALDAYGRGSAEPARSDWLLLCVDAATRSQDERPRNTAAALAANARRDWPCESGAVTSVAMRSIGACLRASDICIDREETRGLIADAVDELERIVGPLYRPGQGVAHTVNEPASARDNLADQVHAASALLDAYERTGRLPYSMLAEELMQFALNLEPGTLEPGTLEPFLSSCEAIRVLCRIAALHKDAAYRAAAVIAPDRDYLLEAERLLDQLAGGRREYNAAAEADYGLALVDWLTLSHRE